MQNLPIKNIPNQSLTVVLDNNQWGISIKETNGCMSVSLTKNGVDIISNMRAVANTKIIPSKYEEDGNFVFLSATQNLPDYMQFGITETLVYASPDELEALRIPGTPPIIASEFDPLGALPLRFAPQGYTLAP